MKLTIILTVYNKEPYLKRALDALLGQVGTNDGDFEVLAVNDGSTDGSLAILEEYAARESRVRILNQKNQGLSMARNNGVDAALGEYIWFVDADDVIAANSVKLICDAIKYSPDVIPIYAKTEGIDFVRNKISTNVETGKDVIRCWKCEQCGVFWIIRKEFLIDNNLRFLKDIYHEDAEFTPRMLYLAKTVKVIPEVLYFVYRDPDSITQIPRPKRAFDYLIVSERLSNFVVKNGEIGTLIGKVIDGNTAQNLNNALSIICKNERVERIRFNKEFYAKRKLFLRALKGAPQKKYHLEAVLFRLFPKQYVWVYKMMKLFDKSSIAQ